MFFAEADSLLIELVHGLIDPAVEDHFQGLLGLGQGLLQDRTLLPGRRATAQTARRPRVRPGARSRPGCGESPVVPTSVDDRAQSLVCARAAAFRTRICPSGMSRSS